MGKDGTDVAKEASDRLLTNDSFVSAVSGISEGKKLFENISKCVKYYLKCKVALIIVIFVIMIWIGLKSYFVITLLLKIDAT